MQTLKNALDYIDAISPDTVILLLVVFATAYLIFKGIQLYVNRDSKKQLIRSAHHNARIQRESIGRRVKK